MLVLSRQPNESIIIGDNIQIKIIGVRGGQVRIGIEAPKDIQVHREEIYQKVKAATASENDTDVNNQSEAIL